MSLSKWNEDKNLACEQAVLPADDKELFGTQRGKNNKSRVCIENDDQLGEVAVRNHIKTPAMLFKGEDGHYSLYPITF